MGNIESIKKKAERVEKLVELWKKAPEESVENVILNYDVLEAYEQLLDAVKYSTDSARSFLNKGLADYNYENNKEFEVKDFDFVNQFPFFPMERISEDPPKLDY